MFASIRNNTNETLFCERMNYYYSYILQHFNIVALGQTKEDQLLFRE